MSNIAFPGRNIIFAIALSVAGCAPHPVPADSLARPLLIVANQRRGTATLIEVESGRVSHVKLRAKPHEVAVSPDARTAMLTIPTRGFLSGRKVVVLDLTTTAVPRTIDLGDYKEPHGVAFLSDSVALVGTLGGTSAVYVDVNGRKVLRSVDVLPGNPNIVALTATGRAFVSSPHNSKVSEIDVANARLARTIDIPDDPAGIAVSADGKELFAATWRENSGGGIAIYDLEQGAVAATLPATQPRRMVVTADGRLVVVSDGDHVRIVDRASRQVRTVALGENSGASGVACSPDSARCYVPLSTAGEVVELDLATAQVVRQFSARPGVDGIAYVAR